MRQGNTGHLRETRSKAEDYLEQSITDAQWEDALQEAQRKLEFIIEREGDADGERRKPYYLGKLVEEIVRMRAFSRCLDIKSKQNAIRRKMAQDPTCIVCGLKCIDDEKERSRLLAETAPNTSPILYITPSAKVNTAAVH